MFVFGSSSDPRLSIFVRKTKVFLLLGCLSLEVPPILACPFLFASRKTKLFLLLGCLSLEVPPILGCPFLFALGLQGMTPAVVFVVVFESNALASFQLPSSIESEQEAQEGLAVAEAIQKPGETWPQLGCAP